MPGTNLTQTEATARSATVSTTSYEVALDLTISDRTFTTTSRIRFTAEAGTDTFVDFIGESVQSITLNGESVDPATHFADSRVALAGLAAENEVVIEATAQYTNTGEGLHRFVDPTDNEVYLYSQFEVPDSRRMFPVFEQPDLKATFQFTVTAPAHWQVVSNEPTPQPTPATQTWTSPTGQALPTATWQFAPTPRISSYITALVAGPYEVVRDSVQTRAGEIPLGIYCRKSLRPHLDADNIFDCTKRGFAFFEREFDQPYPFTKYDQLFTPEYNMGAMENAGCVTINEIYVFRAAVSQAMIERRALTILHELAHMWFGDLVTMRWWDDLWLNESFAEWASTTCQAEATQWSDAWTTFSSMEKTWAYAQDQLSSTHPIVADIPDLHAVESNFDGITYAKGASVLKQLVAYVGREPFVAGLRSYFAKFAWGNTTLADLLTELEATSGRDLRTWSQAWLQTAGVNTIRPQITTDEQGTVTSFVVEQSAPDDFPTLRPHRLAIGYYDLADGRWTRVHRVEVDIDGERTEVPALVGTDRPMLVLLNDDDLAYAKLRLDPESLRHLLAHPTGLDSLPRALVTGALWDMTRDAQMRARDYVRFILETIGSETDSNLLRMALITVQAAARAYVDPAVRAGVHGEITASLRQLAQSAAPGSDAQLQLTEAFAGRVLTGPDLGFVKDLLEGTASISGLTIDTEMRWTLLTSLVANGLADEDDIAAETDRDQTATGKERAERALAARPTEAAKAAAWERLVHTQGLPNQTIGAIGQGFQRCRDEELLRPYVGRYHEMLRSMWDQRTFHIGELIALRAYPGALADPELLATTQAWLDDNGDAPAGLRRIVSEHRDDVIRALRAQERDQQEG